jgi:DNA-binding CsgD family transcriptional regulator
MAEVDEAISLLNESLTIYNADGNRWGMARVYNNLGVIEEDLGNDATAEWYYRETLALAREEGEPSFIALSLNNVALMELRANRLAEAESLLKEGLRLSQADGVHMQAVSCLLALGEIARRRGDQAMGRRLYRELLTSAGENEYRYYFAAGLHALAVLELDAGQPKKAALLVGAVGAFRERYNIGQLEAYSARGYEGDLAAIRGALGEAAYEAAITAGRRLGREEVLALAMEEPAALETGFFPKNPVSKIDPLAELTPREREVALLMAQGRTNEEIGRELFITLKTVEKHAGNALGKLGFRSRVELAGWMAAKGFL